MKKETKKIMWVSGRGGYGKTEFVNSIIRNFEKEGKKVIRFGGTSFIDFFFKSMRTQPLLTNMVRYLGNCDLLVLDDIGYTTMNKSFTQGMIKKIIMEIIQNKRTKVILISQKRARKTKKLKFDSDRCEYIRLKAPSINFKTKLAREWLRNENLTIPKHRIKEIINESNDLFHLRGLFLKTKFLETCF